MDTSGKALKLGFELGEAVKVIYDEGKLPAVEELAKRVCHFTDAVAVGSKKLLEQVLAATKSYFGPKRRSGVRNIRGCQWGELRAMRDLRKGAVLKS